MNETRSFFVALIAGALALGAAFALGASWPRQVQIAPQLSSPDAAARIAQGRAYFAKSCAHCHADDATGDEGPNLHKLAISNAHVSLILKNGIQGEMPNFSKKYDDEEIAAITAFLRSLN